ncbi:MAG: Ig-like domain-containing protein, partial [Anaerolineae bacterium]|nr:Ig-like domain-containing protein [Anaerolineae bacterium]
MKHIVVCCVLLILTALLLAACSQAASTQGPTAWLDEPLDGAALPLEPTEFLAHASDADGVASIEFLIDDVPLARAPTAGGILANATAGWDPQEPGTYTVAARATDSQGNVGCEAVSVVTVGEVEAS